MKRTLSIVLILTIILLAGCSKEVNKAEQEEPIQEVGKVEDYSVWDNMKGEIIGKSNKDYLEITDRKPSKVRNDTTDKWKKSTIAENISIEEYILSYKNLYMEEGDIHFIINFNYNTTTVVNEISGLIYVDIKEYKDKEEHDASKIGNGMLLKSYIIYPDGDIEEIDI